MSAYRSHPESEAGPRGVVKTAALERISESHFGTLPNGLPVSVFTLKNCRGVLCKIMNYGACLMELHLPDRDGKYADVVLGFSRLEDYLRNHAYVGATIGRVANRIAGARFALDGRTYSVTANEGTHHLHGGAYGFDKVYWKAVALANGSSASLVLSYLSRDGEEGYPGALAVTASYTLTDEDELRIDFEASTDQPTPVNLTNHTYLNLAGRGTVLDHHLTLNADHHTPLNDAHIPTGAIDPVDGTAFDFRRPARIGARIEQLGPNSRGFNHNYVLNSSTGRGLCAACLVDPGSGRRIELWTDQPCLQLYTAGYIVKPLAGKYGSSYGVSSGLCLEPQSFPNAVNQAGFPSIILSPDKTYRHQSVWKLMVE